MVSNRRQLVLRKNNFIQNSLPMGQQFMTAANSPGNILSFTQPASISRELLHRV